MKPLFTIHAGEYLVGSYIEKKYSNWHLWVPSKDTGIDLLVTNKNNSKTSSIQVKFSKDYVPEFNENNKIESLQPLVGLSENAVKEALSVFKPSQEFLETINERGKVI